MWYMNLYPFQKSILECIQPRCFDGVGESVDHKLGLQFRVKPRAVQQTRVYMVYCIRVFRIGSGVQQESGPNIVWGHR